MDPLNPPPHASDSEPEDVIEVEDTVESEDETVPASIYEVGESSTAPFLREDNDCSREMAHALVEKKGKAKDEYYEKAECKRLKKELEEARPNEAIDVPVKDEKSPLSELIMPLKFAPLTQAAIRRMIKESVDVAIAVERARHVNVGNDARGSGTVRGQDATPTIRECTFAGFIKCNPTAFHGTEGAVELLRWFEKTESVFRINECAEDKKVKFAAATLQ
ncbi:hypothetical protein Tco_0139445 [Tanacetum coccineum]